MTGSQARLRSRISAVALAVVVLGGAAFAQSNSRSAGPRTLFVDKHAIMTQSRLGQDIRRQVLAYEDKVQAEFGAQGEALRKEMQALQQEQPTLPPDVRAKKTAAFQAKETAYRQNVTARQSLIQGGELVARQRYLAEVGAIVQAIMLERGADMVVEKSSVVASVGGLDITQATIQRLDRKITSFKVPLVTQTEAIQMH